MMVPGGGVEPPWYCYHTILSRARLPVPPLRQWVVPVILASCVKIVL